MQLWFRVRVRTRTRARARVRVKARARTRVRVRVCNCSHGAQCVRWLATANVTDKAVITHSINAGYLLLHDHAVRIWRELEGVVQVQPATKRERRLFVMNSHTRFVTVQHKTHPSLTVKSKSTRSPVST